MRVITWAASVKARNAARGGRAVVAQVDGGRWLALEGDGATGDRPPTAWRPPSPPTPARYRQPGERPDRVAIEIAVDRILGRAVMAGYSGTPLAKKLGIKDGMVLRGAGRARRRSPACSSRCPTASRGSASCGRRSTWRWRSSRRAPT